MGTAQRNRQAVTAAGDRVNKMAQMQLVEAAAFAVTRPWLLSVRHPPPPFYAWRPPLVGQIAAAHSIIGLVIALVSSWMARHGELTTLTQISPT